MDLVIIGGMALFGVGVYIGKRLAGKSVDLSKFFTNTIGTEGAEGAERTHQHIVEERRRAEWRKFERERFRNPMREAP